MDAFVIYSPDLKKRLGDVVAKDDFDALRVAKKKHPGVALAVDLLSSWNGYRVLENRNKIADRLE
jgi:hypothetical protein